jgi:hypothetical protein
LFCKVFATFFTELLQNSYGREKKVYLGCGKRAQHHLFGGECGAARIDVD